MNVLQWNDAKIYLFFFVLVRVSSIIAFLPLLGDKVVSPVIKILFSVALAFMCFPVVERLGYNIDLSIFNSIYRLISLVFMEVTLGALIGFAGKWIFDAVQVAGHFIGTSAGFSIATVLDPHTETQTIALAELQYTLAALLFLSMDGHHLFLKTMLQTFEIFPPTGFELLKKSGVMIQYIIDMSAEVLLLGIKLSAPVLIVTILTNFTFGMLSRAVPQVNLLTVSFSINILAGVFVCFVAMPGFLNIVSGAFDSYLPEIERMLRLLSG